MLMRERPKEKTQQQICAKKIDNDLIELISHQFHKDYQEENLPKIPLHQWISIEM